MTMTHKKKELHELPYIETLKLGLEDFPQVKKLTLSFVGCQ